MEDRRPSGVALRGEASNHPMLRWLKTVVVNDGEKAHLMRQVGTGKAFRNGRLCSTSLQKRRNSYGRHQKQGKGTLCDQPGGSPLTG